MEHPIMTEELAAALEDLCSIVDPPHWLGRTLDAYRNALESVEAYFPDGPGAEEAIAFQAAHSAYRDSSEAAPFRVGDRVLGRWSGRKGTIQSELAHWVEWDERDVDGGKKRSTAEPHSLEPIPALPDDRLDRVWVPGAWIQGRADDHFYLVLSESRLMRVPGGEILPKDGGWVEDGWRFHADSPIQEKREL